MIDGQSLNLTQERIKAFKNILPDVFSEDKIDWERLRQALGEEVFVKNEHYELSWAGKSDARREIQRQTTATLTPDRLARVDFDASDNVFIEGENLEVLRVLQRAYFGRVKMIYIDPPYNTGSDSFIYPDDYAERLTEYRQRTGKADDDGYLNKQDLWHQNRRESGQFHSAWMSMMYPRLFMARNLLREDGAIFVSIDDNEVTNLRAMLDEVFGEENFVACICWQKKYAPANDTIDFSPTHDFVLVYIKNRQTSASGKALAAIGRSKRSEDQKKAYKNPDDDKRGVWKTGDYTCNKSADQRPNLYYPIIQPNTGEEIWPSKAAVWRYSQERHQKNIADGRIWWGIKGDNKVPAYKRFLSEVPDIIAQTWWPHEEAGHNDEAKKEFQKLFPENTKAFDTPKPIRLIKRAIQLSVEPDDIVLDFFAGSATTAQAVMELNAEDGGNRSFVLVQLPEPTDPKSEAYRAGYKTIADVSRERIRRAIQKMQQEADEAARAIVALDATIADKTAQIAEIQDATPAELFDATNPPKAIQRLTVELDKLEKKRTEIRDSHDRLVQTAKNFRAYRLSPSNFNVWQNNTIDPLNIEQLLIDFAQSDKPGAEAERMLTEFLLKTGYPLTTSIELLDLDGVPAYSVAGGELLVLLDGYNEAINAQIWATHPKHVVCLDRLFAGRDEVLANLNLELADRDIKLTVI